MFILKDVVENCLYLDVETASIEKDLETLREKNPRLAGLWSKRAKFYRNGNSEYVTMADDGIFKEKAALEPEFSRIVCVSFGSFDTNSPEGMRFISFAGNDEVEILQKTNKILNNAAVQGLKLCGHNIKGFDIPCIGKRMIYNGIQPDDMLKVWGKKPWEIPYLDTAEVFGFGSWSQQRSLGLDLLTCSLGLESPKANIDGSMVSEYYWDGRISEISTYCEADVKAVMLAMKKLLFE